jgi:PAS domain S-box-containing protein
VTTASAQRFPDWLIGGGRQGDLIRSMDWSATPLGPRERWPGALRAAVGLVLGSALPMALLWGRELVLLFNDAWRRLAGDTLGDALGRSASEVIPALRSAGADIVRAVFDFGETVQRDDGPFPPSPEGPGREVCYSPVRGDDGAVMGVLVTDVAGPAATERALRESEARLRRLNESTIIGVFFFDLEGRITDANDAFLGMVGYAQDDVASGQLFTEAMTPPEHRPRDEHAMAELRERGACEPYEKEFVRKDGSRVWVFFGPALLDETRQRGMSLVLDVSQRKRAEQALGASEETFRKAFHSSAAGMAISTLRDGSIIDVNDTFAHLCGSGREELIGASMATLWRYPPDREAIMRDLRRLGSLRNVEARMVRKGRDDWTGLHSLQVVSIRGASVVVSSIIDITDRKRAEEALRDADRRKTEFLAMISHELRNPLAPVLSSVQILQRAPAGSAAAGRAVSVLDRQVHHLIRLIDDLLDMTRISRGKIQVERHTLDLGAVVQKSVEDHQSIFASGGIELTFRAPSAPVFVDGDATRLSQVVGNLLVNSAKFTRAGGHVALSLEREGLFAVLRVRDDGAGIDPALRERLFDPFVQSESTLARSKGGLGLGLALVKGLVELHGGEVSVESEGIDRGSEFTVRLPLAQAEGAGATRAPSSTPHRLRILVVEDNADAAQTLQEILELDGHDVGIASDGSEGVAKARSIRPDLVLCDIGLPGMNGYDVARALRAEPELQGMRVVALSGYATSDDVHRSLAAGFDEHVAKPIDLDVLERVVSEVAPRTQRLS